jgi:hypothetical protein
LKKRALLVIKVGKGILYPVELLKKRNFLEGMTGLNTSLTAPLSVWDVFKTWSIHLSSSLTRIKNLKSSGLGYLLPAAQKSLFIIHYIIKSIIDCFEYCIL